MLAYLITEPELETAGARDSGADADRIGSRLHAACSSVYRLVRMPRRLNVTLDGERAAKLARLAERTHVNEGTLARSLLSAALDDADPDARDIVALLDSIPGAYERARLGAEQARRGDTVALDEL